MALTEFQRSFAEQRGLDQLFGESGLEALANVLPKTVEAAAHRQGYVSYSISLAIIGYLKRGDFANADLVLKGLRKQVFSDQRGPYKLSLQYLGAFEIITDEQMSFSKNIHGSQLMKAESELKRRMEETSEEYEKIQGNDLDLFKDPTIVKALVDDLAKIAHQQE